MPNKLLKIIIVTPAPRRSRVGNRQTAVRWSRMLRELGHTVHIDAGYDGSPFDIMIGLHAWRSAAAIARFDTAFPQRPLVVALTGTDLYRFMQSHRRTTLHSLAVADRLVTLHGLAHAAIPARYRDKVRTIYQSAPPLPHRLPPRKRTFDVCVVGHLRAEKDSLRAAYAARGVPESSRLRVLHYGKPHTAHWARSARREMAINPRYRWFGELPHWKVREAYARSRALVMSSKMEGGANTVSEAVMAGLPVIASDIPGNVGLLGADYPGYYSVGDTRALRRLLLRAESEPAFLTTLAAHGHARRHLFTRARERRAWQTLLAELRGTT